MSGQPTLRRPGSSWRFGALFKGLTSVVDNSCRSRDSNPQPRIISPTLYPLGRDCPMVIINIIMRSQKVKAINIFLSSAGWYRLLTSSVQLRILSYSLISNSDI